MNKEIKEILNLFKDKNVNGFIISDEIYQNLKDYITNLQQENERLIKAINKIDGKLCSTWQLYYDHSQLTPFKCDDMLNLIEQVQDDLRDILQNGSDKE